MAEEYGKAGVWTAITGAILVLIDGIVVLSTNSFYGPLHYGGVNVTAWTEIILSLIILGMVYYYKKSPAAVGWTTVILALITLAFDGGFYTIGSWIALIGGVLIVYKK